MRRAEQRKHPTVNMEEFLEGVATTASDGERDATATARDTNLSQDDEEAQAHAHAQAEHAFGTFPAVTGATSRGNKSAVIDRDEQDGVD